MREIKAQETGRRAKNNRRKKKKEVWSSVERKGGEGRNVSHRNVPSIIYQWVLEEEDPRHENGTTAEEVRPYARAAAGASPLLLIPSFCLSFLRRRGALLKPILQAHHEYSILVGFAEASPWEALPIADDFRRFAVYN